MNRKPIKRNENILKLSKEHHFSLLFCWKIRQGLKMNIDASRIIKYAQYFYEHFLRLHFREEETFIFRSLDDKRIEKAIVQHKEINKRVAKLSKNTDDNANVQLEKLANLVDDHVRYEERILFPYIERALTDEQLEAIGKKLNDKNASVLKDEYKDEFWVKQ
ncbi:MAG: hemerythrin domain-containing protein [Bacteroidota bacterium]|nr:hemerythrin domain-containing protein [Bacteroidota bacterium]MDQ6890703.1 hemerythrin domain-containing protein [Bacteroidota bacterium]